MDALKKNKKDGGESYDRQRPDLHEDKVVNAKTLRSQKNNGGNRSRSSDDSSSYTDENEEEEEEEDSGTESANSMEGEALRKNGPKKSAISAAKALKLRKSHTVAAQGDSSKIAKEHNMKKKLMRGVKGLFKFSKAKDDEDQS